MKQKLAAIISLITLALIMALSSCAPIIEGTGGYGSGGGSSGESSSSGGGSSGGGSSSGSPSSGSGSSSGGGAFFTLKITASNGRSAENNLRASVTYEPVVTWGTEQGFKNAVKEFSVRVGNESPQTVSLGGSVTSRISYSVGSEVTVSYTAYADVKFTASDGSSKTRTEAIASETKRVRVAAQGTTVNFKVSAGLQTPESFTDESTGDDTPDSGDNDTPSPPPAPTGNVKYVGGASDVKGVPSDTTTHSPGSDVPLAAQEPTRAGFIFMGWISNVDLTGTNDSGSQKINQGIPFAKVGTSAPGIDFPINTFEMPASPVTLTAKWEVNYKYDKADWEVGDVVILGSQLDSLMAIHPNAVTEATVVYALKYHVAVVYKNDAAAKKVYIMGKEQKVRVAWCLETANGHNQDIASLQCEPDDPTASGAYTWTQGQDTDGSGNWQKLQAYLAQNVGNDTVQPGNYPAWEYCNDYANVSAELSSSTVLNNDWYLPTIAELFDIWKVKESVSVSLKALGARFMYRYWSSSQDATKSTYAWFLDFNTGGNYEVNYKTYNTGKNKVANNADFCVFAVHQLIY